MLRLSPKKPVAATDRQLHWIHMLKKIYGMVTTLNWPQFDFRGLQSLSLPARNQLAGVYEAVWRSDGLPGRSLLLKRLSEHAYSSELGTYVPMAENVYLAGKLPDFSKEVRDISS